jgi:hypothetical protein
MKVQEIIATRDAAVAALGPAPHMRLFWSAEGKAQARTAMAAHDAAVSVIDAAAARSIAALAASGDSGARGYLAGIAGPTAAELEDRA